MHCQDEEPWRVVVERVRLRTMLEPDPTSCVAALTPVVARFIEHHPDESGIYN